ncbi:putative pterin-4-alpha-carbinolamine dehydratase [Novipirellula aureliae]|uniref:4a-hydroxytetrahydrobiopterin dehydratase n=1 Tax=Novipirellula aureliae TaxID=2527966 RepID=A0A5C6E2Z6_9BACT|nr:4a-hydroxytetrahydrobiopterin dehydratase [Novipirellula aureliae]TWU41519.1 putative pterin-4-alpha-carbinolamine dehydratase [Novipirellula aureliae]
MTKNAQRLRNSKCVPCEGGIAVLEHNKALSLLASIPDWSINETSSAIVLHKKCSNFVAAIKSINRIAELAEAEQHHPDLHLTGYRQLAIELTTHAIGGLSENDFIIAAKIDQLFRESDT